MLAGGQVRAPATASVLQTPQQQQQAKAAIVERLRIIDSDGNLEKLEQSLELITTSIPCSGVPEWIRLYSEAPSEADHLLDVRTEP